MRGAHRWYDGMSSVPIACPFIESGNNGIVADGNPSGAGWI
jgi:hypothetical protein